MNEKIKVGIVGYGNVGKGVHKAVIEAEDFELVGIFSRREISSLHNEIDNTPFLPYNSIYDYEGKIDVMLMCGGSANDLGEQCPYVNKKFNTVDTYDTHAKIPEYFSMVESSAKESGKLSIISVGWDPGLFSMLRLLSQSVLPNGNDYTFWGKGVSQGHSNAVRRIDGVKDAIQYTIPIEEAIEKVRNGENPKLTARQKHLRECFVVLKEGADAKKVEEEIKTMPNYFADYDTTVHFISEEELKEKHSKMMHGGFVLRSGNTGDNKHLIEYSLKLDSNPEFTASVMVAYARACYRLNKEGLTGAKTVFDVPISYLTNKDYMDIISNVL